MSLSDKQIKAARLRITTPMTQEQIGTAVGVCRTTIVQWFKNPEVKQYMEIIRKALEEDSEQFILKMYEDLRNGIYAIFKDPKEQTYNKLKAAELLYKAAGMFKQKTEITVNQTRKKLEDWLDETEDQEAVKRLIEDSSNLADDMDSE